MGNNPININWGSAGAGYMRDVTPGNSAAPVVIQNNYYGGGIGADCFGGRMVMQQPCMFMHPYLSQEYAKPAIMQYPDIISRNVKQVPFAPVDTLAPVGAFEPKNAPQSASDVAKPVLNALKEFKKEVEQDPTGMDPAKLQETLNEAQNKLDPSQKKEDVKDTKERVEWLTRYISTLNAGLRLLNSGDVRFDALRSWIEDALNKLEKFAQGEKPENIADPTEYNNTKHISGDNATDPKSLNNRYGSDDQERNVRVGLSPSRIDGPGSRLHDVEESARSVAGEREGAPYAFGSTDSDMDSGYSSHLSDDVNMKDQNFAAVDTDGLTMYQEYMKPSYPTIDVDGYFTTYATQDPILGVTVSSFNFPSEIGAIAPGTEFIHSGISGDGQCTRSDYERARKKGKTEFVAKRHTWKDTDGNELFFELVDDFTSGNRKLRVRYNDPEKSGTLGTGEVIYEKNIGKSEYSFKARSTSSVGTQTEFDAVDTKKKHSIATQTEGVSAVREKTKSPRQVLNVDEYFSKYYPTDPPGLETYAFFSFPRAIPGIAANTEFSHVASVSRVPCGELKYASLKESGIDEYIGREDAWIDEEGNSLSFAMVDDFKTGEKKFRVLYTTHDDILSDRSVVYEKVIGKSKYSFEKNSIPSAGSHTVAETYVEYTGNTTSSSGDIRKKEHRTGSSSASNEGGWATSYVEYDGDSSRASKHTHNSARSDAYRGLVFDDSESINYEYNIHLYDEEPYPIHSHTHDKHHRKVSEKYIEDVPGAEDDIDYSVPYTLDIFNSHKEHHTSSKHKSRHKEYSSGWGSGIQYIDDKQDHVLRFEDGELTDVIDIVRPSKHRDIDDWYMEDDGYLTDEEDNVM